MHKDLEKFDPAAEVAYRQQRITHWDKVALQLDNWNGWGRYYHRRLTEIYQFLVAPQQRIIEIGCARGDLLAALEPSYGVGIDFSAEMIQRAQQRHPHLKFICTDIHTLTLDETLDVIILSDILNDLWDVQTVLKQLATFTTPHTRIILNVYSRLWELPLFVAEKLGLATPKLLQNWLTVEDITDLLYLSDFEVIHHQQELLWPLSVPLLTPLANRYLVKIWPFNTLALTNVLVARTKPQCLSLPREPLVSVIIPARNEAGNIAQILERVPEMGSGTELVFVEGHSTEDTYQAIQQAITAHPQRQCRLLQQTGTGKGDAVRLGFAQAKGDILMILDADLTVPPEDLPRFYEALVSGKGEFINGVRLVYPMEKEAMRFMNLLANKFFSLAFSWLLGQPIKDTLCGTKVLWRADYKSIATNRSYFGDFDPFGDFDLLFGAAKINLKIVDLPIRYRERTYGTTNIQRWKHGWLLLKMVWFAARRIKFI
ncbi:MAG: glycosyltransferase [Thioploca sp.]|nr:glycosyltransferase [Thioploca sp.]